MYLMTGMVDPTGSSGGPLLDNTDYIDNPFDAIQRQPFTWTTYPERLQAAGVSWQIYQQGTGFDNHTGNYGTNMLAAFASFVNAPAGSALQARGMSVRTIDQLKADVLAGNLPQVSWLLPPAAYSEHPKFTPLYGAEYISGILDALTANPDVWSRTAFFITYDENDGFFDHMVPPQPPTVPGSGLSTVAIDGERHNVVNQYQAGSYTADNLPYGMGPRVPMTVISPWSRGGFVCSQVFDHTSLIRFIETRFGVYETNITPWRRAVAGDLNRLSTSAAATSPCPLCPAPPATWACPTCSAPARSTWPHRPAARPRACWRRKAACARPARCPTSCTSRARSPARPTSCRSTTPASRARASTSIPATPAPPRAATPSRPARAWPTAGRCRAAAPLTLTVMGPNGFFRRFAVSAGPAAPEPTFCYDVANGNIYLTLSNPGAAAATFTVTDMAYGAPAHTVTVAAGTSQEDAWDLSCNAGWYDLQVTWPATQAICAARRAMWRPVRPAAPTRPRKRRSPRRCRARRAPPGGSARRARLGSTCPLTS